VHARETPYEPYSAVQTGISITLDRYGHLMPGNEKEAAGLPDIYIAAATSA
jgi:hypothetical protein